MEIELYSKLADPLSAITQIGQFFAKSGMFGCDRTEQGQVLAMVCLAERKSPVEITRTYDIVEGKLRKKALAALAEFRASGGKHRWLKSGDEAVENKTAEIMLTDKEGNSITYAYSMEDAKSEGLIRDKSRWTKRPGNMLRARCISNGLGMLCPEIYAGEDADQGNAPEAPAINLAAVASSPAVVTAEPAPVKEVKLEVVTTTPPEDEKELAAAGLAPATPATEVKPFAAGPAYAPPARPGLDDATVINLQEAIGTHAVEAGKWMLAQGWLEKGQGLEHLTPVRAKRILNQTESFIRAITS